jgi:hypothetical protein
MSDELRPFVESRVGFIEHCLAIWNAAADRHQRASAKYCFKQAFFYPAVYYMEWRPFVSEGADSKAAEIGLGFRLSNARWADQPQFDPGREIFHFEHVYTGEMCWTAVEQLRGRVDVATVEALLRDNYAVAWILKEEDSRLPRSIRGTTLQDALTVYERCEVKLNRANRAAPAT